MLEIGYNKRLEMQLDFIIEIDKIKNIFRKTKLFDKNIFNFIYFNNKI